MSASADSIVLNAGATVDSTVDYGEPSPRSSGSYSSRDSRERFIRPTPERAMKILQRLIHDKMHDVYDIPEVFDKHISVVIEKFCVVSLEAQGTLEALSEDNIHVFMQAMEDNRDGRIIRDKPSILSHTPSSPSDTLNNKDIETRELPRYLSNDSLLSMTSINSQDSDNTKSVKKVSAWKKHNKKPRCSQALIPGVIWNKSSISPHNIIDYGLYVIQEHVLEDHITKFELAVEQHEVELMNEKRAIQGKPAIDHNACVVINDEVYVTGGSAEFECVMETFDGKTDVIIMVHVHSSICGCGEKEGNKFLVENKDTGHVMMQYNIHELRFWKELGTSTICMQFKDNTKQVMAPTILFHLESISHCRLFATQLTNHHPTTSS